MFSLLAVFVLKNSKVYACFIDGSNMASNNEAPID